ncbi:MAG: ribosome biogenesis GTPase Der [Methylocystaceae bacterium]
MSKPAVAIVGRPNVGKSTLFNRLAGMRKAIVEDVAGVTRDRIYEKSEWDGRDFIIIDTGGIRFRDGDIFAEEIRKQAELAIEEADVIIMVADAREGMTAEDDMIADILRRADKPVVLAVNKVENFKNQDVYDFYRLGLGEPIPMSAEHGMNTNDVLDQVVAHFPVLKTEETDEDVIKIALVGRPNVGKSSMVNALLGEERVIVSDVPGTTRDAIDTAFKYEGKDYLLIDTAGIRRKSRVDTATEHYSVIRAFRAIERADVCLIIIDAAEGVTEQDKRIAGYVHEEGRANIIVVNKWDLITKNERTMNEFDKDIREELKFLSYAPILYVSALTKKRVFKILELVDFVVEQHNRKVATAELNRLLSEAVMLNPPPGAGKQGLKLYYMTQYKTAPPSFVVFVNDTEKVHFSYRRYLENYLRQNLGLEGTPVRITVRNRS